MAEDRAPLVARLIGGHPRFPDAGRGRYGLTSGAAKMVEMARKQWPDLTMTEFAAGLDAALAAAAEARGMQRAMKALGERWR